MSNIADEILEAKGLTYDDLTSDEQTTYFKWLDDLDKSTIGFNEVKSHIKGMKASVELELMKTEPFTYFLWFKQPNLRHFHLKARLHNYLLLEALLDSPERAKQILESYKSLERRT